jgi:hypothetical protein
VRNSVTLIRESNRNLNVLVAVGSEQAEAFEPSPIYYYSNTGVNDQDLALLQMWVCALMQDVLRRVRLTNTKRRQVSVDPSLSHKK